MRWGIGVRTEKRWKAYAGRYHADDTIQPAGLLIRKLSGKAVKTSAGQVDLPLRVFLGMNGR